MGKIIILDENTSNKIAAGEVIDRPSSLVKELVENSIDANAKNITVEIKSGGIKLIKVIDDGFGIDEDDVEISFERHATSKIRNADDLESIKTMGFRGEALASIAAVSYVELRSRVKDNQVGRFVKIRGGVIEDIGQAGHPVGTSINVNELFFNTPARFKFLKKDTTEEGYISDILGRIALSHPNISIKYISNNKVLMHTPGNNDLLSTIFSIYGKDTAKNLLEINYSDEKVKITGFAGKPDSSRANRNYQTLLINGRYFKSKIISSAIDLAYKTLLMKNKYAFIVLNIETNPVFVDVNVHPSKIEVKFSDEQAVFRSVFHAVENTLKENTLIKEILLDKNDAFKFNNENKNENKNDNRYSQEAIKHDTNSQEIDEARREISKSTEEIGKSGETADKPGNDDFVRMKTIVSEADVLDNSYKQNKNVIQTENGAIPQEKKHEELWAQEDKEKEEGLKLQGNKEKEIDAKSLLNARIIGQVFSTYIILECGQNLILIDQHAAHERIMYEALKKKYLKGDTLSQSLLTPVVIELTGKEVRFVQNKDDFFKSIGFVFEDFGSNSIILRGVPYDGIGINERDVFLSVLDRAQSIDNMDSEKKTDDLLYTIACKAAVKANKHLDEREIKNILVGLSGIENPYTCPHGRPTIISISKYEAEKMFKRII
ncbi:MAG: DNA mismatch repair endonuclease MutL [Clostridia bacterium]